MWEKGEITAFYTSMSNLLQETIFEKLGLPIEEQDKITVVNLLNRVIIEHETGALYLYLRSCIEKALYGGALNQDGNELLAKTKQFIEILSSSSKDTQQK